MNNISTQEIGVMREKLETLLPTSNLGRRILTASILLPIVIGSIIFLPSAYFGMVSGGIMLLAFTEWFKLAGYQKRPGIKDILIFIALLGLSILTILGIHLGIDMLFDYLGSPQHPMILTAYFYASFTLVFWSIIALAVKLYPKGTQIYTKGSRALVVGALVLTLTWIAMNQLHYLAPRWLLYTLILIWVADSTAYFIGSRFGRTRLSPLISPGKSWEGVGGALLGSLLASIIAYYVLEISIPFLAWFGLNAVTVLFSIVGDLFESIFKRVHHLKDSGKLLPGHGGIMDRIDSLTAALPVFTAIMMLFGSA